MRFRLTIPVLAAAALVIAGPTAAQYGHPLKGSWSGDWGPDENDRHRLLLLLDWNGEAVTGTINPGPNAVPITAVTVDYETWRVRIEAERRDADGNPIVYAADGVLQNISSYNSILRGSWTDGEATGDFTLLRGFVPERSDAS